MARTAAQIKANEGWNEAIAIQDANRAARLTCPACGRPEAVNTVDGTAYASCGTHIRIIRR